MGEGRLNLAFTLHTYGNTKRHSTNNNTRTYGNIQNKFGGTKRMKCEKCKKLQGCAWINGKFVCTPCYEKISWKLGVIRRERKRLELAEQRGDIRK